MQVVAQAFEIGQDVGLARLVQRGERFVHQQEARRSQDRPAQRHALPFAARERAGAAVEQIADAEETGDVAKIGARGGAREAATVEQVLPDRHVGKESRILKDIADAAAMRRDEDPAGRVKERVGPERDVPFIGAQEARDGIDDAGLARARAAEERGDARARPDVDVEREAAQCMAEADRERHAWPMRRATARLTHSARASAPIATAMATRASRAT